MLYYLLHEVVGRELLRDVRVELLLLATLHFGTFNFHLLDPADVLACLQLCNQVDLLVEERLVRAAQALHAHAACRRAVRLAQDTLVRAGAPQLHTVQILDGYGRERLLLLPGHGVLWGRWGLRGTVHRFVAVTDRASVHRQGLGGEQHGRRRRWRWSGQVGVL